MTRHAAYAAAAAALLATLLTPTAAEPTEYFFDDFSNGMDKWTPATPPNKEMGKWDVTPGKWFADKTANQGLTLTEDMRFYSLTAPLATPATSKGKDLVIQFSAKIENHQYAYCGGGYIKLLPAGVKLDTFGGDDEYAIMFGPDLCGYDVSHVHAIFSHKGENLLKSDKIALEYADKNEYTHLYTLVVKPDGTYQVLFDLEEKAAGKLVDDWAFPQPTIDDASDSKPADWVDDEMMDDPDDVKPAGWDDIPAQIADPDATKPDDWDDEDDGEWEAPMVDNPEYKGEWAPKRVTNPAYKGEWKPKQVANPKYEEGVQLAAYDVTHIGFELWVVNNGTIFDNILVTDDLEYAKKKGKELFTPLVDKEKAAKEAWDKENKPDEPPEDDEGMDDDDEEEEDDDEEEKDEL